MGARYMYNLPPDRNTIMKTTDGIVYTCMGRAQLK